MKLTINKDHVIKKCNGDFEREPLEAVFAVDSVIYKLLTSNVQYFRLHLKGGQRIICNTDKYGNKILKTI